MTTVDPTPPTPPVVIIPPTKSPWLSKVNIGGALLTILGIATYFTAPEHTPHLTVASISEAIGGVVTIVFRTWYTNQPVTQFAADNLRKAMLRRP